jgi:hypothetical protein
MRVKLIKETAATLIDGCVCVKQFGDGVQSNYELRRRLIMQIKSAQAHSTMRIPPWETSAGAVECLFEGMQSKAEREDHKI